MKNAYILINSISGLHDSVYRQLKLLEPVKEIYQVNGSYDIVLKVEESNQEKLRTVIQTNIRKLDGIGSTMTMIVI